VSFTDISYDLQSPPGLTHTDIHAIVFHPDNPNIVFVAGDGGVSRTSSTYGSGSNMCEDPQILGYQPGTPEDAVCRALFSHLPTKISFLNRGLQTIQLFNVSADPSDPLGRIMAGSQDNSTLLFDSAVSQDIKTWNIAYPVGDGTSASGFHPTKPDILFASFQNQWFVTNFQKGSGGIAAWDITSAPILYSNEPGSPAFFFTGRQFMSFDPVNPDTQFTGFAHVWRTLDNGGDRSFLDANCSTFQVFYVTGLPPNCGDWTPLGAPLNDSVSGFGPDRSGGLIVAAQRSAADGGSLWAATNIGRVFITHNADDPTPSNVNFARVDSTSASAPGRFISGIAVDAANPNRAWISYTGFNALTPTTPGHVFEVTWDPGAGTSLWKSLDYNLGDLPVNHVVRDSKTGDLYAATDFGVIVLRQGSTQWRVAGRGLPAVLTPFLQMLSEKRMLFAGTHGLGAWYLPLR
jgi:hypothetical protein